MARYAFRENIKIEDYNDIFYDEEIDIAKLHETYNQLETLQKDLADNTKMFNKKRAECILQTEENAEKSYQSISKKCDEIIKGFSSTQFEKPGETAFEYFQKIQPLVEYELTAYTIMDEEIAKLFIGYTNTIRRLSKQHYSLFIKHRLLKGYFDYVVKKNGSFEKMYEQLEKESDAEEELHAVHLKNEPYTNDSSDDDDDKISWENTHLNNTALFNYE